MLTSLANRQPGHCATLQAGRARSPLEGLLSLGQGLLELKGSPSAQGLCNAWVQLLPQVGT